MSPNAADTRGNYVSAVEVTNGRIDITFGGPRAHQAILGQTLSVTPYETNGNTIVWQCGFATQPAGVRLAGGARHQPPTVEARYLPSACR
jgi:type IV pilus assembly protein PilA